MVNFYHGTGRVDNDDYAAYDMLETHRENYKYRKVIEMKECGKLVNTIDRKRQPCKREMGHKDGCNPFSNTAPAGTEKK